MVSKILSWIFLSLICCNLFAQINDTDEFRGVMSKETTYLKKTEKKIRRSSCYKMIKKQFPSIVNGKIQIVYTMDLKKKLTREEFTYRNIMDNIEFRYHNSKKFPDNQVHFFDKTSYSIIDYEKGQGIGCLWDYDRSGALSLENYIIPNHATIDTMQPDFVFMAFSVYFYFLVKGDEIYVLSYENELMSLSEFVEKYYDEHVKKTNL